MKILVVFAIAISLLMVILMITPTFAVNGPLTQGLQYKFYSGQDALFTGLLNNEIDIMAWPLTYPEWTTVKNDPTITLAPYFDLGDYEISFNSNMTDASHTADRKAMNYTDFRQAIACLIDKDGLISGPILNGFATRIDTQVPRPDDENWVNLNVSKYDANGNLINNYPWDYSETHALTILWNGGWYSHTTYPTLSSLLTATLPLPANSVIYPPGHPRAGQPIDTLVQYTRSDHPPRKAAGEALNKELVKLGFPVTMTEGPSSTVGGPVFIRHNFDIATIGWSFSTYPTNFGFYAPSNEYPYGFDSAYMIDDANLTHYGNLEYFTAPDVNTAIAAAMACQQIIVEQAYFVPLYCSKSYAAYRTGVVGAIDFRGYALTTALDYTFLNAKVPNAQGAYTAPMTIRYGTLNPPVQINPIFGSWVWDYETIDRMYNGIMDSNPYNPTTPGKSPTGSDQPWMAYDWTFQLSNFTGWANDINLGGSTEDPYGTAPHVQYTNMANCTYWFRHDITWQDGVPFTVDDWNYTLMLQYTYGDAYLWSNAQSVVGFQKIDNWTCSIYFCMPSFWMLYDATMDVVPMHIFQNIQMPDFATAESASDATHHHGFWPGQAALSTEVTANPYFTYAQLQADGASTWIGTGMWKYVPGTLTGGPSAPTGMTMTPYTGFWMSMVQGDIDMKYTWNPGPAPQGGSYKIGLSDLVMLANAFGTSGKGSSTPVPFKLGGPGVWEPGCDIAPPAGVVGLTDLVTLALNYGKTWGSNP